MSIYPLVFSQVLSRFDPERVHHLTISALGLVHRLPGGPAVLRRLFSARGAEKSRTVAGIDFPGAFGLAAGFDKNAQVPLALLDLGFTHVEIGTVTARPQDGNDTPRLFRLVKDRAVINRMGFNNEGAVAVADRLRRIRSTDAGRRAVIGVNIGKNKTTALEDAAADYAMSARLLSPYASYLTINVSSPNTPNLRALQAVDELRPILSSVREHTENTAVNGRRVPLFVKIAPDLHDDDVVAVARLALELGLDGIIATNTTIERPDALAEPRSRIEQIGAGGLSGPILRTRSLEVLDLLVANRTGVGADGAQRSLALISAGGVRTAEDVIERLERGADLVQGFTSMIYEGPSWPGRIAAEVARRRE
ncbi:quinone-dependent dihydroorotate dehydrogenase [Helcobacillus massiliensis]|uniref:quinone-dependent dihydroorotate dehydrogenase n=1 Tax=Helcobacillus massiliensis TaxID=521392 RepID=UPI0021A97749|nr:quinone-dependent dihydroorotate dehydrogenase [Helcobacillus massiliensis]MCT1557106.1 quinone-dependent dihydroorotate dehydrogenase [Helcobacillus massiliensis]MCT2036159.1 quinone-dependent dihydroorotate dehydrogenase [Helcobacillus massiliensis]MCT2331290.1 quinone-dependent dihydroorotate dehydrogenase [Helcobacillus massiliensis]